MQNLKWVDKSVNVTRAETGKGLNYNVLFRYRASSPRRPCRYRYEVECVKNNKTILLTMNARTSREAKKICCDHYNATQ